MTVSIRPNLLILTSSFPREPEDETCAYLRDFARSLSDQFKVTVLAPPDRGAGEWPADDFVLKRSALLLPSCMNWFQATRDFNNLPGRNIAAWLGLSISLAIFFAKSVRLAARADVICSHWLVPCGAIGAIIARLTGKPHIVVEHSGALHLLSGSRLGRAIARFVVASSDRLITVSDDLRNKLAGLCPAARSKVEVVGMGVHTGPVAERQVVTRGPRAPATKAVFLFVGRLTEVKGVDVLLSAMTRVSEARLVIAGDGEQRSSLETLARTLGVDAAFLGRVGASERARLLGGCDAVVIPSRVLADGRTEGAPVVCLEAMAAGRPVIAARAGGLAEIVVDGQNGLLFEPGDESGLARNLIRIAGDPDLREMLAINARVAVADHTWARIGSRFGEIIRASMKGNDRVLDDQELDGSLAGC